MELFGIIGIIGIIYLCCFSNKRNCCRCRLPRNVQWRHWTLTSRWKCEVRSESDGKDPLRISKSLPSPAIFRFFRKLRESWMVLRFTPVKLVAKVHRCYARQSIHNGNRRQFYVYWSIDQHSWHLLASFFHRPYRSHLQIIIYKQ